MSPQTRSSCIGYSLERCPRRTRGPRPTMIAPVEESATGAARTSQKGITGPSASAMIRFVAAASSSIEVKGICAADRRTKSGTAHAHPNRQNQVRPHVGLRGVRSTKAAVTDPYLGRKGGHIDHSRYLG